MLHTCLLNQQGDSKASQQQSLGYALSQAAAEANAQLEAAYTSLEQSFQTQQTQFAALVQEQQSSSSALLRAAQDAVALTQRELKVAQEASAGCQACVHGVLTQQNAALTQLQEGFAQRMSNGQVRHAHYPGKLHGTLTSGSGMSNALLV